MRKLLFASAFCLWFNLHAQPVKTLTVSRPEDAGLSAERLARIDKTFSDFLSKEKIPGAVVMIVRNGRIAFHKAYGYRNVATKEALKKDDIFRIASQTKAITSLAVMMLFEEGKFLLDDPISKYIPEFKSPKILKEYTAADTSYTTEAAKGEITIRHLLTHTSGLDYPVIGTNEFKAIYAKASIPAGIGNEKDVLADKMKALGAVPLKHQPGTKWTYGLSSDVLGYLVEVVSGMPFDKFLRERIFDPLGMNDTWFYLPSDRHGRLVRLHEYRDGKFSPMTGNAFGVDPEYPTMKGSYFSGGAGLSGTTEDYAKFLQLFLNKGEYNGKRLLSRKTVELMLTDQVPDAVSDWTEFGLGFGLETERNDARSMFSVGSFSWGGAFSTTYWADPQENLVALLYTNVFGSPHWEVGETFKVLTYQAIND